MNFEKLCNENCKLNEEFLGQNEQNAQLTKENRALKEQLPKMKKLIPRRPLPSELVNEMFAVLPLENAFNLLTEMPNGLLARNVRKMLKSIKLAMKNNKWNEADCGQKLTISEAGQKVGHADSNQTWMWSCVRALFPIPKFNWNAKSIRYFEVEIVKKDADWNCTICIGFCDREFPLEDGELGFANNTIGICFKCGKMWIEGDEHNLKNGIGDIQFGVVIGIGIIKPLANSPMLKCFATYNGKSLEMVELPEKFATVQLFPAVILRYSADSIRANFGQEDWQFNPNQLYQCEK